MSAVRFFTDEDVYAAIAPVAPSAVFFHYRTRKLATEGTEVTEN
jgi:hypothetical protein